MLVKAVITLIYGIIIAGGGIIGYVAARSKPSLISGGILGAVAIIGSILMFAGKAPGMMIALIAAVLLAVFFIFQMIKGVPGGARGRAIGITTISLIEILVLLLVHS